MMGGASFEDDIAEEIMQGCPQVDYIHCGDAEETFPQIVQRVYARRVDARACQASCGATTAQVAFAGRAPNLVEHEQNSGAGFRRVLLRAQRRRLRQYGTERRKFCCRSRLRAVAGGA